MSPLRGVPGLALLLLLVTGSGGQSTGSAPAELCGHTWEAIDDDKKIHYSISVCEAHSCGQTQAAICAHDIANSSPAKPVGNFPVQVSNNVLLYNTDQKCEESDHKIQSVINLVCWKSLGTPEFVKYEGCVYYFEWRTFAACKRNKFKPEKEVPCYVFDTDYRKHDLNPLINPTGGYLVEDSDEDSSLYINICRTIGISKGDTQSCPPGSAACIIKGDKAYDVGQPKNPLASHANDKLILQYETTSQPEFCGEHKPTVTITFICPTAGTEVSPPKLTAFQNCRYEVEWVTENACHVDYLETDECKLNARGVSIDLTPLTRKTATPYHTEDEKGEYVYYLNVCGATEGGQCSGEVSSCQFKKNGGQKKGAGSFHNQNLRYSDGDITLTYSGGEPCSSGFQRMTVINFECNETAENDGIGEPEFDGETDCTYFFSWETKYACPKKKEELCRVEDKKKHYNLFDLIRSPVSDSAQNWEAETINPSDNSRFFINVCHEVLQKGDAVGCEEDAAVCLVGTGTKKNLGKFLSSPKLIGNHIVLEYTEGSDCGNNKKIQTNITLICSPGDLESPPILKHTDGCLYNFEWNTAAACVLSRTEGDDCRVSNPQAGFNFDLSPLSKKGGAYHVTTETYDFYLNVCSNVTQHPCDANSGACQVTKPPSDHWNIGVGSSKLSYYDGIIQLSYTGGTPYNDAKATPRSSLITFLCDRDAGIGEPEYQKEDNNTYNFKWYTKYACPALPVECIVVDEKTNEQYDLSRLSRVHGEHATNWYAMDESDGKRKKYYINVCQSLIPVPGCDPFASSCKMSFSNDGVSPQEIVEISNLGVASKKPEIESNGRIILEYTNGSECTGIDGKTTYSTELHLVCKNRATSNSPIFTTEFNCKATFIWYTEAACPVVKEVVGKECKVDDPNTGFVYNLEALKNDSGYIAKGNGKTYKLNICGPLSECGLVDGKPAAGCEIENGKPTRPVGISQNLDLASNFLSLTYNGALQLEAGKGDTFIINFVCDDDLYPGELSFKREEINSETKIYNTMFDFKTAMACSPSLVDCQVTDSAGNEYDLSDLGRDNDPWIALDTSSGANNRTFYLNVCKPLPYIRGCPGGLVGSCMKTSDNKGLNLGFLQMSPQASADGTLTIVYMSGDKCGDNKHYSTRILFQCDQNIGSPVFQEKNDCEYVFLWRTSEACPVIRAEGDNCKVTDPKYGHVYDLKPLGAKNIEVRDGSYTYQLSICGEFPGSKCASLAPKGTTVGSCQVSGSTAKLAGLTNQKLIYEDGIIMLNYFGGDLCHQKYNRSTHIVFSCDKTEQQPIFTRETSDCIYMFQWRTPLACPPFKPIDCAFKDADGNSYDLSPLSQYTENWEVEAHFGSNQKYRLNVCKPLVSETGPASCPYGSAACLMDGANAINLGEPVSSPKWENGVAVLQYKNGDLCPDGKRNRTATIRFMCNSNQLDSKPQLITTLEDCNYNFLWSTHFACKLKENKQDDCRVTNPITGHVFDLTSLTSKDGYQINSFKGSVQLNICGAVKSDCDAASGVCITENGNRLNAGKANQQLTYTDQVLRLVYSDGDQCRTNPLLKHKSIFTFVCAAETAAGSGPTLGSYSEESCTWQFTWHTSLVCEKQVKCSVKNGTSEIDLRPLMKLVDNYKIIRRPEEEDSADFYINICQPLNDIADVKCPPGVAACRVTPDGKTIDIGRPNSPPAIDETRQTVSIKMDSFEPCGMDKKQNYSTLIIFQCNVGAELGSPKFLQLSDCMYVFEWATPLVCSDEESISGCSLTDQQLHYTFNLSSLSGETFHTAGPNPYYIGVCSSAVNVPGKCSGSVCQASGNTAVSFGSVKTMQMEYHHVEDALELQYTEGDPCPPVTESGEVCLLPFTYKEKSYSSCITEDRAGLWCPTSKDFEKNGKWGFCSSATDNRKSTILFKCDENAGKGLPVLISETNNCAATFEWKTQLTCLPKKLDCKFITDHKTYDLRMLSSLTGSWAFSADNSKYYLNLCHRVNQGPSGCSENAAVCRERNGNVLNLGQVHTQKINVKDGIVSVTYINGDLCSADKRYSTVIELTCANVTGTPKIKKYVTENCQYFISWEVRAACAVVPKEVSIAHGIIHVDNGLSLNLSSIYVRTFNASGDLRAKDQYMYEIQLSGKEDSSYPKCKGASVCQVKTNGDFTRAVGTSAKAKFYVDDDDLEVVFTSNSPCGKDKSKNATSTIFFHCSQVNGEGRPEFLHETSDCQYLFSWYTAAVCPLISEDARNYPDSNGDATNQYQGLSGRSQAVGAILSILLVILVACLVVLLLYKKERRDTMIFKLTNCCRRSSNVSYKYTKINTEEEIDNETEWLMEEVSGNHGKVPHENGHVRSVKAEAFTTLHVDDLDSEDEVLTIPEVRIKTARNPVRSEKPSLGLYTSGSDENLIGVPNGGQAKTERSRSGQHKKERKPNVTSFHDDSDEDMLNI